MRAGAGMRFRVNDGTHAGSVGETLALIWILFQHEDAGIRVSLIGAEYGVCNLLMNASRGANCCSKRMIEMVATLTS